MHPLVDGAECLDQLARADYEGPVEMLVGAMGNMMPLFNLDDQRQLVAAISAVRTPRSSTQWPQPRQPPSVTRRDRIVG